MKKNYTNVILSSLFFDKTGKFLVLLTMMLFSAHLSWGSTVTQDDKVLINLKNASFSSLVEQVSKQTKYTILFKSGDVKNIKNITINKRCTVKELLTELFSKEDLQFTFKDNSIVITKKTTVKSTETKPATAIFRIIDMSNKQPIPGATILIKGTNKGAIADGDGVSKLTAVKIGEIIEVSVVGYKGKLMTVTTLDKTVIVALEQDVIEIENVVVTGYQKLSKERSAGSYTIVKGDDIKDKAAFRGDIVKSFEGISTGLSMNLSDGEQTVLMRGVNSINSNKSVLYVVDGVAMGSDVINDLVNNNDIESVTFLKDATAASIWGARAANGVIVITTRRGDKNKKMQISYDGSFTFKGRQDNDYLQFMSTDMFMKNAREIFDPKTYTWDAVTTTSSGISTTQRPTVYPHEQILYDELRGVTSKDEMNSRWNALSAQNNRKQLEKYLQAKNLRTNHSLSLNGGGESYRYYGSFMYEYNQTEKLVKDNKYIINLKQELDLTKWMKFDATINLSLINRGTSSIPANTSSTSLLPYMMLRDENGNNLSHSNLLLYQKEQNEMEGLSGISLDYRPLDELEYNTNDYRSVNVRLNTGLNITLFKGLTFDSRYQFQRLSGRQETFFDEASYVTRLERNKFTSRPTAGQTLGTQNLPSTGGIYTNGHSMNTEWTIRNQFIYDNKISDKQQLNILAGTEVRNTNNRLLTSKVRGYDPQALTYTAVDEARLNRPGIADPVYPNSGNQKTQTLQKNSFINKELELRFVSFYGNLAYTYDNKYTINGSVRVDQSNLFGSDPSVQFKPLWSVGTAWNIKNERFLTDNNTINALSLRASYGLGGNSPDPGLGGPYDILNPTSSSMFPNSGYEIITPANDKLIWEKTQTLNIGVDFAILDHAISGSVEYYNRITSDLLNYAQVNPASGWETTLSNIGSLYNKGIEIAINSRNISKRRFQWTTNLTFTNNKNRVTELYDKYGITASNMIYKQFIEGYAAYSLFAFQWAGLDNVGDPQVYNKGEKVKLYKDFNDAKSVKYQGSTQPLYYGALTNSFRISNFNLSFMFVYNFGHKIRNDINTTSTGRLMSNLHQDFDKRWRNPGDNTNIPSYNSVTNYNTKQRYVGFYQFADINVLNASYVKLRDITLSYSLPPSICRKLSTSGITVKFQVGDLFTIKANKEGIDPEYHNAREGLRMNKFGASYSVGINVRFK